MSKYAVMPITDYSQTCDAIREKTGGDEPIKSGYIPKKITEVFDVGYDVGYDDGVDYGAQGHDYDQGYEDGHNEGYSKGYDDGRAEGHSAGYEQGKEERDLEWWTKYQNPGVFYDFGSYMFAGKGWNRETFKPKFTIGEKSNCAYIFSQHNQSGEPYDLVEHLKTLGVDMDFSETQVLMYAFANAVFSRIGVVDLSGVSSKSNCNNLFGSRFIETIDGIVFSEKAFDWHENMFNTATGLINLVAMGVIANNGLNFSACINLTHDSLMSIINALKDFGGTGETRSIIFGPTNLAKLTDAEKAIATQKGWTLL